MSKKANKFLRDSAVNQTLCWMQEVIDMHERVANDLKRYRKQLEECAESNSMTATPVNVLSWFVNHASTCLPMNMKLTNAVNLSAALALTEKKE